MRPDDERWPAVREAARRILRTPHVRLEIPDSSMGQARNLVSAIAEADPARLALPELQPASSYTVRDADDGTGLVCWANNAPEDSLLFLTSRPNAVSFEHVISMAHDLVEAGYPGCLGCGGPGLEAPWDELAWRTRQDTTSFK